MNSLPSNNITICKDSKQFYKLIRDYDGDDGDGDDDDDDDDDDDGDDGDGDDGDDGDGDDDDGDDVSMDVVHAPFLEHEIESARKYFELKN